MTRRKQTLEKTLRAGGGVLSLMPAWVPRDFIAPGGRMKLPPSDLYGFGAKRGGIDERWLASATRADNGPDTLPDEGLSRCLLGRGETMLLVEAFELMGQELLGDRLLAAGWTVLGKIFDNLDPLPVHMHPRAEDTAKVSRQPKPEAYYFPAELNLHEGSFPWTGFGLAPGTTKADIKRCLENWEKGENGILRHVPVYRTDSHKAYNVPAGVIHRPGTLVTFEPQRASDVCVAFEALIASRPTPWRLVTKDVPPEHRDNLDYIVDMIDWDTNLDPDFLAKNTLDPVPAKDAGEMREAGYSEQRIVYGQADFAVNEIRVRPEREVTLADPCPYGLLAVAGHGRVAGVPIESPTFIRFGEPSGDELFVGATAAAQGVTVANLSKVHELVLLKTFAPAD